MSIEGVISRYRRSAAQGTIRFASRFGRDGRVGYGAVRAARLLGGGSDSLVPVAKPESVSRLPEPLIRALAGSTLGVWAFGSESLAYLMSEVRRLEPALILEFGSGVSTVCLAWEMQQRAPSEVGPLVVSLEQDEGFAADTRDMLARAGLHNAAKVVVTPLIQQVVDGLTTECYAISPDVEAAAGGTPADFIVIDGPAGGPGVRLGTIPLARHLIATGARFYLDDALRDAELEMIAHWRRFGHVRLDGIRPIGHGVATGSIEPPVTGD